MLTIDLVLEETHYWGMFPQTCGHLIWIGESNNLSRGYGTMMTRLAIEICFAEPSVEGILVDPLVSNIQVYRFYEQLEFERLEERYFGEDHCYVYHLKRKQSTEEQENDLLSNEISNSGGIEKV